MPASGGAWSGCTGRWPIICSSGGTLPLAVFIGLMLMAATALQTGRVRMVFFPDIEEDIVEIQLSMAAGTPAGEIREATRRIEAAAGAVNDAVRKESGIEEDTIRNMVAFFQRRDACVDLCRN